MKLTATKRNKETKTYELHNAGLTPAIVYGKSLKENILISIEERELRKLYKDIKNKETFTLDIEGTKHEVILQDMQVHVTSGKILNVDFLIQK